MSVKALDWAFAQHVGKSGAKFVLVALADYADDYGRAWPCIRTLGAKTDQERRTVLENLRALRAAKLVERMPERIGKTRRVVIYRLAMPGLAPHQTPAIPRRRTAAPTTIKEVRNPHHSPSELSTLTPDLSTNGAENDTEIGTKPAPGTVIEPSLKAGSRAGAHMREHAPAPVRAWTPGAVLKSSSGISARVGREAVEVDGMVYQNAALANVAIAEKEAAPIPQSVLQYRQSLHAKPTRVDKGEDSKDDPPQ